MPRFLHAAVRGLFYPAVIIAITIALAASHGAGDASAATHRAGAAAVTRHHEPIAHIAKAPKGAKKPRTA
jgi:hypothetical protein